MSDEKQVRTTAGESSECNVETIVLPSEAGPGQRLCDVISFMVLMSAAAFVNGYAIPETNQTADLLNTKYEWTGSWEKSWHQSLIGSSCVAGMAIGAVLGGKLIQSGRRRSMIISTLIGSVGSGLMLIENFYCLCLGRLIFGFTGGVYGVTIVRFIFEYVPVKWQSGCMGVFVVNQCLGAFFALCSGLILPKDDDTEGQLVDTNWRLVFALPLAFFALILLGFTFVIRQDSVKYYLSQGDETKAMKAVHAMYLTGGSSVAAEQVFSEIRKTMLQKTTSQMTGQATLKEAFVTDERYRRASWVNVGAMIFHELTAINIIMAYSNTILENILGDPSEQTSGFTARQGTYVIGLTNLIASTFSIWTIQKFGRRTLLLFGHVGIFLAYLLMGIFTLIGFNSGVLAMLCLFLLIYQNTSGPVAWTYASETCCDISLGVCIQVLYSSVFVLSLVTEPLMDSALQPAGVFFLFSFCSFCAVFYMYWNVAETMGLTDAEKKQLFYPGTKFGRKLRPGEQLLFEAEKSTAEDEIDEVRPVGVEPGSDGIGDSVLTTPFLTSCTQDKKSIE